jgi:hypothetical protein
MPLTEAANDCQPVLHWKKSGCWLVKMMVGFFDVAVPAGMDGWKYFIRRQEN